VRRAPGLPCALCLSEEQDGKTSGELRRETADSRRLFDNRSRNAIVFHGSLMLCDAPWSLSSGAHSRDLTALEYIGPYRGSTTPARSVIAA
jgi:hypothetical protein